MYMKLKELRCRKQVDRVQWIRMDGCWTCGDGPGVVTSSPYNICIHINNVISIFTKVLSSTKGLQYRALSSANNSAVKNQNCFLHSASSFGISIPTNFLLKLFNNFYMEPFGNRERKMSRILLTFKIG